MTVTTGPFDYDAIAKDVEMKENEAKIAFFNDELERLYTLANDLQSYNQQLTKLTNAQLGIAELRLLLADRKADRLERERDEARAIARKLYRDNQHYLYWLVYL